MVGVVAHALGGGGQLGARAVKGLFQALVGSVNGALLFVGWLVGVEGVQGAELGDGLPESGEREADENRGAGRGGGAAAQFRGMQAGPACGFVELPRHPVGQVGEQIREVGRLVPESALQKPGGRGSRGGDSTGTVTETDGHDPQMGGVVEIQREGTPGQGWVSGCAPAARRALPPRDEW